MVRLPEMVEWDISKAQHHTDQVAVDAAHPGKTVAAVLGEIVWLMSQDAEHKHITVGELEDLVMPAILLRQFRLFYEKDQPVAVVLYARASASIAERLRAEQAKLALSEWQSGDVLVIVRTIAPFGGNNSFEAQVLNFPR